MVTTYDERYKKLNPQQRAAVDHIDGPLLVVAGPGTGKTELLSMRTANILKRTDTLPSNILCLTFTDSGANAMRERLSAIIGADAYRVAIHTFHSFGTEIINQNNEFFYHGADFKPADELASYELLTEIFDELDHTNPLASRQGTAYTYLDDVKRSISELKQAGLTSDELLRIISGNEHILDSVEAELSQIFTGRMSVTMLTLLAPLAERIAAIAPPTLPPAITSLGKTLALSMARAFDTAVELGKTTPITEWRNKWMEKDKNGTFVFKDRTRNAKLRALSHIYYTYLTRMEHAGLYDYDDMIMTVVHAIEAHADLKYNLQERYQYIMVDEFQDTNLAQLRIIYNLTENPVGDAPNIMAVGDDDQAIYSFQGADVNNIHRFREHFDSPPIITLINNYRSAAAILQHAREVIVQGDGRLEATIAELDKKLTPNHKPESARVELLEYPTIYDERAQLAQTIKTSIAHGARPEQITVIARRHNELVGLLPYFAHAGITVNYEKRDNVLDEPIIQVIELILSIIDALQQNRHDVVDSLLPELLSHPAYAFPAESIWKLSLQSYRNHQSWLEIMAATPEFVPLQQWLVEQHTAEQHTALEPFLDRIIGTPNSRIESDEPTFVSPLYDYYFSAEKLQDAPDAYLTALEALRTIRTKLREYHPNESLRAIDFLDFIQTYRDMGSTLTSIHRASDQLRGAVNLMTAHKSKGLEFAHVYIIGAIDSAWGERVRSRSRLISYPENLRISPSSNTYDERLRLFFVAMTRAKNTLTISYSLRDENGRDTLPASFLVGTSLETIAQPARTDIATLVEQSELSWRDYVISGSSTSLESLLRPMLETYKLSATHLNNFIDITRGGPQSFLLGNLLRFPQAKSAQASYGTAIHAALQHAHTYLTAHSTRRPVEDVLGDFTTQLADQHLAPEDFDAYAKRGANVLTAFLKASYDSFQPTQKTELSFAGQGVIINGARLTGSLDLVDIADHHITVTDYKTGKPSHSWKGASDPEKIKLHKYKQQLMFYQLLCEHSRDYAKYTFDGGVLQFVEPDKHGDIHALNETFTTEELDRFKQLVTAVWRRIMTLDFPDTSQYDASYKGILEFENNLIDEYAQ